MSASADPQDAPAEALLTFDAQHIWHPYSPMPNASTPYLVDSASGVRLRLDDGRELIDAMSSWWSAIHGYRNQFSMPRSTTRSSP